jgi:hypothetical protein
MRDNGSGDGRGKDERVVQRIVDVMRRKIAQVRAEYDAPRLMVEPYTPPKLRPRILPTPDELISEMLARRDAAYARAEEASAYVERLRLDADAAARRRRGVELLQ